MLVGQQPVPEWALGLARADLAFLIDASVGLREDRVRLRRLTAASATDQPMLDSHTFGPSTLLALARSLYGWVPETYLVELPAEDLGFGEGLSAGTARAVERVGRYLDRRLASVLNRCDADCTRAPECCDSD